MISFISNFASWILLIVLALFSFVLSMSETAVISTSKIKLRHLAAKKVRNALEAEKLIKQSDRFIISVLVGNNFTNIAFSAIVTAISVDRLGPQWGVLVATVCTTAFILVFCDILPKTTALKSPERMAMALAPLMTRYVAVTAPVSRFFTGVSEAFLRVLGIRPPERSPLITEEELRLMIEVGKEEGVVTDEERRMLHRIFEFGDTRIADVMVPREKIVAVNVTASPEQLLNIFVEEGHARLPVYRGSVDRIIGVVYARDILYMTRDKSLFVLADLIHNVPIFPPKMQISDALRKFQAEKIQIAIVAEPGGVTQGLVTLEDLTEEIVGEIEEKYSRKR